MNKPKEIIIVLDPLDGPHIFTNEKAAVMTMKKWHKEAQKNGGHDSYWDMSDPYVYKFDHIIKLPFEKEA